jgi:hypothetical protein
MHIHSPITAARLWSKVDVRKSENDCWEWQGSRTRGGYGRMKIKGKSYTVTRLAWEMYNNSNLGNLQAMHTCDNPRCCNPKHIKAGTHQENMDDMAVKGRARGKHYAKTLSAGDNEKIRSRVKSGEHQNDVAISFGITGTTLHDILKRGD